MAINETDHLQTCNNAFSERMSLSASQSLTISISLSLMSPTIIIINILLIMALLKTKQIKNDSQRFILILGISDFIVGALSVPLLLGVFNVHQSCAYEKVSLFVGHFNTRLTAYIIFLIGIDRYFNINPNMQSRSTLGKKIESKTGCKILIATVIVISTIQASIQIIDFENRSLPSNLSSGFDFIVYLTYFIIYIRLFMKIRKFTRSNSLHQGAGNTTEYRPRYIKNLVKTVLYLLVTVGLCYLPYVMVKFTIMYRKYQLKEPISQNLRFIHYLSFQPILANSFFNTVIILDRNSVLKQYILRRVFRWQGNNTAQEISTKRNSMLVKRESVLVNRDPILAKKDSILVKSNSAVSTVDKKDSVSTDAEQCRKTARVKFSFQKHSAVFTANEALAEVEESTLYKQIQS